MSNKLAHLMFSRLGASGLSSAGSNGSRHV